MSSSEMNDWNLLLAEKSVTDLKSRVTSIGEPDFDGNTTAQIPFAMALDFKASGGKQSQPLRYTATVKNDGGSWRIQDLQAR